MQTTHIPADLGTPSRVSGDARAHRVVQLIGVASGIGAPDARCRDGPLHLLGNGIDVRLSQSGTESGIRAVLHADDGHPASKYRSLGRLASRLAGVVGDVLGRDAFPVVIGGDHSCAIGTWSGVARATAGRGALGMVWIDAHMDSHTPATSPSGRPHGMPLAALLGYGGRRRMSSNGATLIADAPLSAAHTSLVGVRSYEREEAELLLRLGVRVFDMTEIAARGMHVVMSEAVDRARCADAGYGVSIDLDAVDPIDAPGVGSRAPGGIAGCTLVEVLRGCAQDERLLALEIAEYNPHRDVDHRTADLVEGLLCALLARTPFVRHWATNP